MIEIHDIHPYKKDKKGSLIMLSLLQVTEKNKLSNVSEDSPLLKRKQNRGRRGKKAMNTRCFKCNKSFQQRLGYKTHIRDVGQSNNSK